MHFVSFFFFLVRSSRFVCCHLLQYFSNIITLNFWQSYTKSNWGRLFWCRRVYDGGWLVYISNVPVRQWHRVQWQYSDMFADGWPENDCNKCATTENNGKWKSSSCENIENSRLSSEKVSLRSLSDSWMNWVCGNVLPFWCAFFHHFAWNLFCFRHFSFLSLEHTAMQEQAQRAMAKKRQQQQQLISENAPENNENRKFRLNLLSIRSYFSL